MGCSPCLGVSLDVLDEPVTHALRDTVVSGDAPRGDKDAARGRRTSCVEYCALTLHLQCLLFASCLDLQFSEVHTTLIHMFVSDP